MSNLQLEPAFFQQDSLSSRHIGVLAVSAAAAANALRVRQRVRQRVRRAERDNQPVGKFIYIDGVRLHFVMREEGPPVILSHGNTVTHADFLASGLLDQLTLTGLGIERPVVVGHSMGSLVALALDYPGTVSGLVLAGGYFYPTGRVDAFLTAPVALPVLSDLMRYTVTALSDRALLNRMVKRMFAPVRVPPEFHAALAREMMRRPLQLAARCARRRAHGALHPTAPARRGHPRMRARPAGWPERRIVRSARLARQQRA